MTDSTNPVAALAAWEPKNDFYIGIDSDGCAFDTMELKHKQCFTPNTIRYWKLQPVSKYAREATDFVNLYSRWRGTNRWPALVKVFDLLRERPEVCARNVVPPQADDLRAFIDSDLPASADGLRSFMASHPSPELECGLQWNDAVNQTITDMVEGVPPFPHVRKCLEKTSGFADLVVVSATPCEALDREWQEHDLAKYIGLIAGQEMGTKAEILCQTARGRYDTDRVLMVGDAPGDLKAARAADALFYPINPGQEADSWARFRDEAADRFLAGTYAGDYETERIREFEALLPETPPWQ